jgi:hypothetical protein
MLGWCGEGYATGPCDGEAMTEGDEKVGDIFRILILTHIPYPTSDIHDSCFILRCSV